MAGHFLDSLLPLPNRRSFQIGVKQLPGQRDSPYCRRCAIDIGEEGPLAEKVEVEAIIMGRVDEFTAPVDSVETIFQQGQFPMNNPVPTIDKFFFSETSDRAPGPTTGTERFLSIRLCPTPLHPHF